MPSGKEVRSTQRRERRHQAVIDASAGTLTLGSAQMSITVNGTGDFTLTFNDPYARAPYAQITGLEDNAMGTVGTRAVGSIQILIEDASSNAAADLDVYVDIVGWDSDDET